jgi:hypothetical protein
VPRRIDHRSSERRILYLNPSQQHENDNDDQDDADDADTAVSITVTVAAEAAAKTTQQKNDEDDNENESYRHKLISPSGLAPWLLRGVNDRNAHSWRLAGYLDLGFELLCERFDDGGA